MKYIFATHSHTAHLTALGTIEQLKIDSKDVIFTFTRNFDTVIIPEGCKVVKATEIDNLCYAAQASKTPLKAQCLIKRIDAAIATWVDNDEYELFTPHLCIPFFLLLYTYKKCRKVSFIQEGLFTSEGFFRNKISMFDQLKRKGYLMLRYATTRLYGAPYWYCDGIKMKQAVIDAYGITPDFFKHMNCSFHLIQWPKNKLELTTLKESSPVFIFDGFVVNGMSESDYYLSHCKEMIQRFCGDYNYIRFHPNQVLEERNLLLSYFDEKGVSYEIMDDNIPFEYYITQEQKMTIVGMGSTLLFLGHIYGHRVICCDTWMLDSPMYKSEMALGRPLYHEFFSEEKPVE